MGRFSLLATDGAARFGRYKTDHGELSTPNFMPVGTKGTVKGVDCERLKEIGSEIILVNTYHLWLRPGAAIVKELGGIHKFSGWNGPILSDSGGFQIYSLKGLRKISEEGVEFASHIDGSSQFLTPEKATEIQEDLGVDIAMVLDECPSSKLSFEETKISLERTIRWEKRSLAARRKESTSIFGITQGGLFPELRGYAASVISEINFDGVAIGGLSVGESKEEMYNVLNYHVKQLPNSKIRYLMGVGTPEDIIQAVSEGVDLFDCVIPTRSGRFGRVYVGGDEPVLNIRNARFSTDSEPLDTRCSCLSCRNYSRAYLHHLVKNEEMLGPQLLTLHNLTHYMDLMRGIRSAIIGGYFQRFYAEEKGRWDSYNGSVDEKISLN